MKHQVCVTLNEETLCKIREQLININFRSRSHLIECAIGWFLNGGGKI